MPNRRSFSKSMPMRPPRPVLVRSTGLDTPNPPLCPATQPIAQTESYSYTYLNQPSFPLMNEIAFEAYLMAYLFFALMAQYIYIFKTVWWYPTSLPPSSSTINFHLIDINLTIFLLFLFSKRFISALLWNFFKPVSGNILSSVLWISVCIVVVFLWLFQLGGYIMLLFDNINLVSLALLLCPLCFWLPYNFFIEHGVLRCFVNTMQKKAVKPRFQSNLKLSTVATNSVSGEIVDDIDAKQVRQEVECLCQDFNTRFAEIVFYSLSFAYYVGLVPMYFTKSYHSYNFLWSIQHTALVLTNCFIMLSSFLLPAQYLCTLNKSAMQLGGYMLIRDPMTIIDDDVDVQDWSASTVFPSGSFVRYKSNTYRTCGRVNTAIPDDRTHAKFFMLFYKPLKVLDWLLASLFTLICYQIYIIVYSTHWDHVLAPAILQFFSYYILRTILRDRIMLSTFLNLYHD